MKRFKIKTHTQFLIIPSFGIVWTYDPHWKWSIAFDWLNIQFRIAFGRRTINFRFVSTEKTIKPLKGGCDHE